MKKCCGRKNRKVDSRQHRKGCFGNFLRELGEIPCELQKKIQNLESIEVLKALHKLAARADSLHTFEEKAEVYFNSQDKE